MKDVISVDSNSKSEDKPTADLELRQHQQGVEIPVLGKTELLGTINKIKDNVINGGSL